MNQEKFKKIVREELEGISGMPISNPAEWKEVKPKIEKFVKEVDKAAEIFEMENAPKKGK
jgi:hypothetical protein